MRAGAAKGTSCISPGVESQPSFRAAPRGRSSSGIAPASSNEQVAQGTAPAQGAPVSAISRATVGALEKAELGATQIRYSSPATVQNEAEAREPEQAGPLPALSATTWSASGEPQNTTRRVPGIGWAVPQVEAVSVVPVPVRRYQRPRFEPIPAPVLGRETSGFHSFVAPVRVPVTLTGGLKGPGMSSAFTASSFAGVPAGRTRRPAFAPPEAEPSVNITGTLTAPLVTGPTTGIERE